MRDDVEARLGTWRHTPTVDALLCALQAVHERVIQLASLHLHPVVKCSIRSLAIGGLMYLAHPTPLPVTRGALRGIVLLVATSSAFALLSRRRSSTADVRAGTPVPSLHDLSQLEVRVHPDCTDVLPLSLDELQVVRLASQGSNFMVQQVAFSGCGARRLFALKTVGHQEAAGDIDHARACLARETDLLFKCSHDSIAKALCVLNAPTDKQAVLMEWLPCGNLFTLLQHEGHLCEKSAVFCARQVVSALEHLHDRWIAHRDLKPENLLVDAHGHLKLTGLGYGKIISERSYTIVGTLPYIAPEVLLNEGHGLAVDWWALGVLLYEITVGKPPFGGFGDELTHYTCGQIISGDVVYPSTMSVELQDLISRLLDKLPQDRLGSGSNGAVEVWRHPYFLTSQDRPNSPRTMPPTSSTLATYDSLRSFAA